MLVQPVFRSPTRLPCSWASPISPRCRPRWPSGIASANLLPPGGRLLAIWRFPLKVGGVLPTVPLPLAVDLSVAVNLDATYARAAADAYLS